MHRFALLVGLVVLLSPALALAQSSTLLVLPAQGVADAATAQLVDQALGDVGRANGLTVLAPAPGVALASGDDAALVQLAQSAGVDRAVQVTVTPLAAQSIVVVHVATRVGTAATATATVAPADVAVTAARALAALLATPSIASPTAPAVSASTTPSTVAAPQTVVVTPTGASAPPPRRRGRSPGTALWISGIAALGAGWVLGAFVGLFGGYHDTTCIRFGTSSCPTGTSWDPAWDTFRASSIIPLVGPWVQLGVLPDTHNGWTEWLVIDGLIQAAGLVLILVGVGVGDGDDDDAASASVRLVPSVGPGQAGLTALGRF